MRAALLLALLVTAGCGTILRGSTQPVQITGSSVSSATLRDLGSAPRFASAAYMGGQAGAAVDPFAEPAQREKRIELPARVELQRMHTYVVDYGSGREVVLTPKWDWPILTLNLFCTAGGLLGWIVDDATGNGQYRHADAVHEPAVTP